MVDFNYPGGSFEPMFGAIGPLFTAAGGPDMEHISEVAAQHGVTFVGPPLGIDD